MEATPEVGVISHFPEGFKKVETLKEKIILKEGFLPWMEKPIVTTPKHVYLSNGNDFYLVSVMRKMWNSKLIGEIEKMNEQAREKADTVFYRTLVRQFDKFDPKIPPQLQTTGCDGNIWYAKASTGERTYYLTTTPISCSDVVYSKDMNPAKIAVVRIGVTSHQNEAPFLKRMGSDGV